MAGGMEAVLKKMCNRFLKSFVVVAELSSINQAAAKLKSSPTAIMRQMDVLEENLGITLFVRSNHGVKLTAAGEYFYRQAKDIISRCDRILRETKKIQEREAS